MRDDSNSNAWPAFPVAEDHKVAADLPWTCGMTLRDYFAAKAMRQIDPNAKYCYGSKEPWAEYASACYELADAMLKARQA